MKDSRLYIKNILAILHFSFSWRKELMEAPLPTHSKALPFPLSLPPHHWSIKTEIRWAGSRQWLESLLIAKTEWISAWEVTVQRDGDRFSYPRWASSPFTSPHGKEFQDSIWQTCRCTSSGTHRLRGLALEWVTHGQGQWWLVKWKVGAQNCSKLSIPGTAMKW
jgi:hypothetical protein